MDLVAIKLQDFDMILVIDFLGKYNAKIDCRKRGIIFSPYGEEEFSLYGQSRSSATKLLSAVKAWKMLANGCQGYLANIMDKDQEVKLSPKNVPIIREYVDVFPKDFPGFPPERENLF